METNGLSLSEMNLLLLKKVEELTLYLLQQDKRIRELEKEPPQAPPKGESKRATGSS
jgi:hypothetical protein